MSLLEDQNVEKTIDDFTKSDADKSVGEFKEELRKIFNELHVPHSKSNQVIDKYFSTVQELTQNVQNVVPSHDSDSNAKISLDMKNAGLLFSMARIGDVIAEWKRFQKKQDEIFEPRDSFIRLLDDLFFRKTMHVDDLNELHATTESDEKLDVRDLSSGEKQMLILLGESLLQRGKKCIYIADEPELSLHVDWQEKLIPSLLELNPSTQIVFATHSPDIVGRFGDNVIDMESLVQ
ncbi:MAG: ATP-binding protein [Rhodospirillales bacterium]|nr:ATP-binding protein [Rhodospirillales bacterium]